MKIFFILIIIFFKQNINKINSFFYLSNVVSSLESLPEISKWNTENVIDINFIFFGCISLKSLPDISKWKP